MIDVSNKYATLRTAAAIAAVKMTGNIVRLIKENKIEKGNVLETARIAGIMAAKKTADLIPHCHSLPVDSVSIDFSVLKDKIIIIASAKTIWKTGIEMEALTACSIAALTVYDMVKPYREPCKIEEIKLLEKRGGKSDFADSFKEPLKVCILVTSDSTALGKRRDKSGGIIKEMLLKYQIRIIDYKIAPDDKETIKKQLKDWADKRINIIFTAGGTGLGPRDVTVEAAKEVIDKEVPGISEAMRNFGQQRTPYSMLSRGISGLINKTLVINLPGSSKGVTESLCAILPGVFHLFPMMEGKGHNKEHRAKSVGSQDNLLRVARQLV
jgi:molybdenum cofactor biosynthesis protein MoaC